jgi:hypothetical protein
MVSTDEIDNLDLSEEWISELKVPSIRRRPGRPIKRRIQEGKRDLRCGKCSQLGHNSRTVEIEVGVHMSLCLHFFLFFKINTWNVSHTVLLFFYRYKSSVAF